MAYFQDTAQLLFQLAAQERQEREQQKTQGMLNDLMGSVFPKRSMNVPFIDPSGMPQQGNQMDYQEQNPQWNSPQVMQQMIGLMGREGGSGFLNNLMKMSEMGQTKDVVQEGRQGDWIRWKVDSSGKIVSPPSPFYRSDLSMMGTPQTPTQLSKLQSELTAIKKNDPQDPRIPQYESAIKKETEFAPYFTLPLTTEGMLPFNARTGKPAGGAIAQKPPSTATLDKIGEINTLLANTDKIKEIVNLNPESKDWIGPVAGRWGDIKEEVAELPEQQNFLYSYVRDIKDALLRARSGAQINEQEYKRLSAFLPDITLPMGNFMARLDRFKEAVNTLKSEKIKAIESGGYGIGIKPAEAKASRKVGEIKTFPNGKKGRWDGKGWELVDG